MYGNGIKIKKEKKGNYYDKKLKAIKAIDEEIKNITSGDIESYKLSSLILYITSEYLPSKKVVTERLELMQDTGLIKVENGVITKA